MRQASHLVVMLKLVPLDDPKLCRRGLMFQVGPTIPDKTGSRLRPDKGKTLVLQVEGLAGGGGRAGCVGLITL